MSGITVKPLNPGSWLGLPALACVLAALLFAVPARLFQLMLPEPVFPMAAAFAWAIIRPSVLPPFVLVLLGLFMDILWGGPMGLWPVCLLAAYAPVSLLQRALSQFEFIGLGAAYAVACLVAFGLGWCLASARAGVPVSLFALGGNISPRSCCFPSPSSSSGVTRARTCASDDQALHLFRRRQ